MIAKFKTCFAYQTTLKSCDKLPHYAKSDIKRNKYQWLTDGYYFWLNSDIYAKWWGECVLQGEYEITKYEICIERDKVLDLLENPKDEEWFVYILSLYLKKYEEYKNYNALEQLEQLEQPSVSTIITFMNDKFKKVFPLAIFITDASFNKNYHDFYVSKNSWLRMTPNSKKKHEVYKNMGKPQVCVFENAFKYIKNTK